jgi:6-phosphogluconate dehydrogenase
MQIGMIGLGRMGSNMVLRLIKAGHECVVFDMMPQVVERLVAEKAIGSASLKEFIQKLRAPRAIWLRPVRWTTWSGKLHRSSAQATS